MNPWERFNNWIDPKFGWHVVWIVPMLLLISLWNEIVDLFRKKISLKRAAELDRLRLLADIKEKK